jgi:hypothetical protein
MSPGRLPAVLAAGSLLIAGALAGCGAAPATSPAGPAVPAAPPPLQTSFADGTGTGWAVVEMGGSAAQEENFWELFARPAGAAAWRLVTPGGVADNGGLVAAPAGGASLLTGFLPSQDLTFSPLAATSDGGTSWSTAGPVNPGLAHVPDALAAGPGGSLIALTRGGAELGQHGGAAWTRLSSARALAATPAGQACQVTGLTAVAFGSAGAPVPGTAPVLGTGCSRPAFAGIFTDSGGHWHAAGPAVPNVRTDIEVLRLASAGTGLVALLQAGRGPNASTIAAWYDGSRWTLSAPLRTGIVRSTAIGPGGSVGIILNAAHAATLAGPGASWRALPALPRWTATLALGPGGQVDAIAAHASTFTDWRLSPAAAWSQGQTIRITIPYGSSG